MTIRDELRRAAAWPNVWGNIEDLSDEASLCLDAFSGKDEYLHDTNNVQFSWFMLMVAECL